MRPLAGVALAVTMSPLLARTAAPAPAPVFVPGLYETETRNAAFRNEGARRTTCIAAADAEAFRRETIARYGEAPQFGKVCTLSDSKPIADGFALAMDCGGARTIIAYHFAENLVASTTETSVAGRPDRSSMVVTLWRRIGACAAGRSEGKDR